jgi:ureidoglycolate lyase
LFFFQVLLSSGVSSTFKVPTCSFEEIEDGYGTIIGVASAQKNQGLTIPFYKSTVIEGKNFDFQCRPPITCRTAEIHLKENNETLWLERHMYLTQVFIGIGAKEPFMMVLGKPTHDRTDLTDEQKALPDLNNVKAFIIPPGKILFIFYFFDIKMLQSIVNKSDLNIPRIKF